MGQTLMWINFSSKVLAKEVLAFDTLIILYYVKFFKSINHVIRIKT